MASETMRTCALCFTRIDENHSFTLSKEQARLVQVIGDFPVVSRRYFETEGVVCKLCDTGLFLVADACETAARNRIMSQTSEKG